MKITIGTLRRVIKETVEESTIPEANRDELISIYSDVYKEKHGVRPHMLDQFDTMSTNEIEAELKSLEDETPTVDWDNFGSEDDTEQEQQGVVSDEEFSDLSSLESLPSNEPVGPSLKDRYRLRK